MSVSNMWHRCVPAQWLHFCYPAQMHAYPKDLSQHCHPIRVPVVGLPYGLISMSVSNMWPRCVSTQWLRFRYPAQMRACPKALFKPCRPFRVPVVCLPYGPDSSSVSICGTDACLPNGYISAIPHRPSGSVSAPSWRCTHRACLPNGFIFH